MTYNLQLSLCDILPAWGLALSKHMHLCAIDLFLFRSNLMTKIGFILLVLFLFFSCINFNLSVLTVAVCYEPGPGSPWGIAGWPLRPAHRPPRSTASSPSSAQMAIWPPFPTQSGLHHIFPCKAIFYIGAKLLPSLAPFSPSPNSFLMFYPLFSVSFWGRK